MTFTLCLILVCTVWYTRELRSRVKSSSPPERGSHAFLDRCSALPIPHHTPKRAGGLPCGVRERDYFYRHTGEASHLSTTGGAVGTLELLTKQVGLRVVGFSGLLIVNRPRVKFGSLNFRHVDSTSDPEDTEDRSDARLERRLDSDRENEPR